MTSRSDADVLDTVKARLRAKVPLSDALEGTGIDPSTYIAAWRIWKAEDAGLHPYRRVLTLLLKGYDYDTALDLVGWTSERFRRERKRRKAWRTQQREEEERAKEAAFLASATPQMLAARAEAHQRTVRKREQRKRAKARQEENR